MTWAALASRYRPHDKAQTAAERREKYEHKQRIIQQGHIAGFARYLKSVLNDNVLPRTKFEFEAFGALYAEHVKVTSKTSPRDAQADVWTPDPYLLRVVYGTFGFVTWGNPKALTWIFKDVEELFERVGEEGKDEEVRNGWIKVGNANGASLKAKAGIMFTGPQTENARGIIIKGNPAFGNVKVGSNKVVTFELKNVSNNPVKLTRIESKSPLHASTGALQAVFATSVPLGDCLEEIKAKSSFKFVVTFCPQAPFIEYRDLLFFQFNHGFVVLGRYLGGVGMPISEEAGKILLPSSAYQPRVRTHFEKVRRTEEAPRFNDQSFSWPRIQLLYENNFYSLKPLEVVEQSLTEETKVSAGNYMTFMSALIHAEENQLVTNMKYYDLPTARFQQAGSLFILEVPGLAEKRPSILYGDRIVVQRADGAPREGFRGRVKMVERDQIRVMFGPRFMYSFLPNMTFHVRFEFSRLPVLRQHDAIHRFPLTLPTTFLFPESVSREQKALPELDQPLNFFQRHLNEHQKRAVDRIVRGNINNVFSDSAYLIFGPPGTGKTVTLVESILQLRERYKHSSKSKKIKVLATATSNTAADLVAQRLLRLGQVPKSEVFRLNSISRNRKTLNESLLEVSCENSEGQFALPSLERLQEYTIIVSTNMSAARLHDRGLAGHFDFIFIDEAGQATEAETLSSFVTLWKKGEGRIVLCGDPRQLGPVIRCRLSEERGLGVSLMERLMKNFDRYKPKLIGGVPSWNDRYITKLVKNYRSHPALLTVPSQLFYSNELVEAADPLITRSLTKYDGLPNKNNFPFIFHSVAGKDEREGNSPSFFNAAEAWRVAKYVKELLTDRSIALTQEQVGIITPYRKQVEKIRALIRSDYPKVRVSSCEEFQGQESRVIIISTVRSSKEFEEFDRRYNLGFVRCPKRMNVAITRAQALLIVVGNPDVLASNKNWRALIRYAVENGAYTGDVREPEELFLDEDDEESDEEEEGSCLRRIVGAVSQPTPADHMNNLANGVESELLTEHIDVGAIELPSRIEE